MEYIYPNLPNYTKITSRAATSNAVVSSGAVLLFSEDGETLTAKHPDGTYTVIGSGGTDVSDTTATGATVLSGYDFYNSSGIKTSGTIPTVAPVSSGSTVEIASGYLASPVSIVVSGGVDVSDTTATPADVLSGAVFHDSTGALVSGGILTYPASTYTPTTSAQYIPAGVYLGGSQTIAGDANLVPGNIVSGVTIFGVTGTASGGGATDFYQCASVTSGGSAWSGYKAVLSGGELFSGINCYFRADLWSSDPASRSNLRRRCAGPRCFAVRLDPDLRTGILRSARNERRHGGNRANAYHPGRGNVRNGRWYSVCHAKRGTNHRARYWHSGRESRGFTFGLDSIH